MKIQFFMNLRKSGNDKSFGDNCHHIDLFCFVDKLQRQKLIFQRFPQKKHRYPDYGKY
ncbi:MAG: hypothetical protein UT63_C0006G0024 [Candidatus Gottesmanbacteria bacterium GW2011_GWC2_39_8]|uniref:Uncharacterized protein n=1 Tax=Candidatus Gottesmanbacteria bacterium GW2011_GWC2_39_8 TaxID=1618450 RepID=A0A0G0Q9X3_9BACT|nr:MAG: hypothetical protein UT63_C0006G0024 [Candidatus Gottesmanbacteria bacterium GW2011_GWC2_39_8]